MSEDNKIPVKALVAQLHESVDDFPIVMYNSAWQEWYIAEDQPRIGGKIIIDGKMHEGVVTL